MGHRASVAYATAEGVTCHYSHWGAGRLLDDISEATPLGSENHEPEYMTALISALGKAADESDMEVAGKAVEAQEDTLVSPEPYAICENFEEWATQEIDYLMHESAYYIDTTQSPWEIRAYAPMYWSESLNVDRESDEYMQGCIVEAGEMSHDLWGGIEAENWPQFLNKARGKAKRILGHEVELIY